MVSVKKIPSDQFEALQDALEAEGFTFEERSYQVFLARKSGVVVNLYESGKVVHGHFRDRRRHRNP